jgi:hypothetical protein
MKKIITKVRQAVSSKTAVAGAALGFSGFAGAVGVGDTITAAFAAGQANLGLAAAGVITMVAVLTGIGMIVSMLRK